MLKLRLFLVLSLLSSGLAEAQSFYAIRRNRNLIANFGTGTANYFGDLVNPGTLGKVRPSIIVGAEYFLTDRISTRAELTWFQIAGDDKNATDDRNERNLSFRANNIELSLEGTFNLTPVGNRFYQRPRLNFYGFAGIGLLYSNPKTDYKGQTYALQPLQTEGVKYSKFQPVIPFGFGAKIMVDPFFNILIEAGYRLTFTDYLDDVSVRRYPDPAIFNGDQLRIALSDRRVEIGTQPENPQTTGVRGNPDKRDSYLLLNVKLQYYLPFQIFQNSNRKLYNTKRRAIYRKSRR